MPKQSVPSDVVLAIIRKLGANGNFPSNVPSIHLAFYKMSLDPDLKEFFADYIFDTSQVVPYSDTVTFAIERLNDSEFVSCPNPGLKNYTVTNNLEKENKFDSVLSDDKDKEEDLLNKAVEIFREVTQP